MSAEIRDLLDRSMAASGSDPTIDRDLAAALLKTDRAYTASIEATIALVQETLPGWWWKIGTCCVSDDACIAPDFNHPIHGPRLRRQFDPIVPGSEIDAGFDVDRRPPGNLPLALIESLLRALLAQVDHVERLHGNS